MKAPPPGEQAERGASLRRLVWRPRTVAVVYVAAAGLWILVSDRIVRVSVGRPGLAETVDSIKGLAFVVVTGLALYLLLRRSSRRIEQALADSERRYRVLFNQSPIGKLVCDGERIVMANDQALGMFRARSLEQVVGHSLFEFVPEARRAVVKERLDRFQSSGTAMPLQQDRAMRLDGQEIDI